MKRAAAIVLVVGLVLVLGTCLLRRQGRDQTSPHRDAQSDLVAAGVEASTIASPSSGPAGQITPLLGESILRDYANTNLSAENDLMLMSRLMQNSLLLLKSAANGPLSANEDWAALFRGQNAAHEQFLSAQHIALNAQGQLVDRWAAPLFFHALGGGRYEIRSAGPDKKLWTTDDIHRNADGSFRRGPDLDSPSLMETATRGRSPATAP